MALSDYFSDFLDHIVLLFSVQTFAENKTSTGGNARTDYFAFKLHFETKIRQRVQPKTSFVIP